MDMNIGEDKGDWKRILFIVLWGIALTFVFVMLAGCKTTEYVEVPVTHTEYVYRDKIDTAYVKDSVYIKEMIKGDTVKVVEYRYRDRFRYINTTDTVAIRDTVSVVHEVVVEKTVAKMNSIQSAFFWLGMLTFILLIGYIAYRIVQKKFKIT